MLYRAARAMFDDEMAHTTIIETRNGQPIPKTPEWIEEQWAQTKLAWRRRARTMLTAIREPTDAIWAALPEDERGDYMNQQNWGRLIDAMLTEKP